MTLQLIDLSIYDADKYTASFEPDYARPRDP